MDNPAIWWMVIGFALLIIEILTGAWFFLWLSFAAFVTAVVSFIFTPAIAIDVIVFSLASLLSIGAWWIFKRPEDTVEVADGKLNNRMAVLIGREAVLQEPVEFGRGRVNIDDAWWQIEGENLAVGTRIKVEAVNGMILRVRAVE